MIAVQTCPFCDVIVNYCYINLTNRIRNMKSFSRIWINTMKPEALNLWWILLMKVRRVNFILRFSPSMICTLCDWSTAFQVLYNMTLAVDITDRHGLSNEAHRELLPKKNNSISTIHHTVKAFIQLYITN